MSCSRASEEYIPSPQLTEYSMLPIFVFVFVFVFIVYYIYNQSYFFLCSRRTLSSSSYFKKPECVPIIFLNPVSIILHSNCLHTWIQVSKYKFMKSGCLGYSAYYINLLDHYRRVPSRTCFFRTCRGGARYPKILWNIKNWIHIILTIEMYWIKPPWI
jgi:hypothetical protein